MAPRKTDDATPVESHPTIRPTVIQMVVILIVGITLILYLRGNPELLGERQRTQIAIIGVTLLVVLGELRLLVRAIVFTKTTYTVTDDRVKKEYQLFFRREQTEIPFDLVRSHEFSQSRIESVLGYGTIRLNRGLGTLQLENVERPHALNDAIRSRLE